MSKVKRETEDQFADRLAARLRTKIKKYKIETRKSVLYSVSFDDVGSLDLHQNKVLHPKRGKGRGFQQDILIYQNSNEKNKSTDVIPRVILEVKLGITSHDAIVYSEKAQRIRRIYPFVRYGLILAGKKLIPTKVVKLGPEFDFIYTISSKMGTRELNQLSNSIRSEISISKKLGDLLSERIQISEFHRILRLK